jgi:hypothetical protein
MAGEKAAVGQIGWHDLTVEDAEGVRDFYKEVVGWESSSVPMGYYDDFNMTAPGSSEPVAGVCHSRGPNATLPAAWLIYVKVADLDEACKSVARLGGAVLDGPREMGGTRFACIQDPAGAKLALYQD